MNKSSLKTFAIESRVELQSKIITQLTLLQITEKEIIAPTILGTSVEIRGEKYPKKSYDALVHKYKYLGYKELVEEVAYTWFNRLVAIGFMEANGYIDEKMVFSAGGKATPDILDNYYEQEFFRNLSDNKKDKINFLKDENKDEELYSILVEERCKELSKIMPFMFEGEGDYVELLFPKGILMENSFISKLRKNLEESKEQGIIPVELIGWLYQFYNAEKKAKLDTFLKEKSSEKVNKNDLPTKTQLFTNKWIVKYMAENSIGKLALENFNISAETKDKWKYFIDNENPHPSPLPNKEREQVKLEDIKIIDPCMGSGHMLVYSFELLFDIYVDLGWTPREAVLSILQNNIYGLDIDDRAAQLASFALIMTARTKFNRLFKTLENENIIPHTHSIKETNELDIYVEGLIKDNKLNELYYLIDTFKDAKELGSTIKLREINLEKVSEQIERLKALDSIGFPQYEGILNDLLEQAKLLASKYDVTITNPPFLGTNFFNVTLKKFLDNNYKLSKKDLFAVFIERAYDLSKENGYISMITMESWMFLSSFEEFRNNLIEKKDILSLVHMPYEGKGNTSIGINFGTVAFVIKNTLKASPMKGNYSFIQHTDIDEEGVPFEFPVKNARLTNTSQQDFHKIPGSPIAYWVSDRVKEIFEKSEKLGEVGDASNGVQTGNNDKYLRLWYEVNKSITGLDLEKEKAESSHFKWFPYNKGGDYRKWFGNNNYLVDWENNGLRIKSEKNHCARGKENYFNSGITWADITSSKSSFRYFGQGFLFDAKGPSSFFKEDILYILSFLNSNQVQIYTNLLNPTLSFQIGEFRKLPLAYPKLEVIKNSLENIAEQCILISKSEWDSRETSWDYKKNQLAFSNEQVAIKNIRENPCSSVVKISEAFDSYTKYWSEKFFEMHRNEEELNRLFIEIYGLEDEMTPNVDLKDITLLKKELLRRKSAKKATEEEEAEEAGLILDSEGNLQFNKEEIIKQFISYAVGCIMGRYSLDKEGLVIANSDDELVISNEELVIKGNGSVGASLVDAQPEIRHTIPNPTFIPDAYGIIPVVSEDGIFTNDLLTRFIEFVGTVYGKDTLKENLDFIACALEGKDSVDSPKETIKKYLLKDFITDHIQRYSKRPIYWMFNSGKENGFNCLVYMHRYNPMTIAQIRTDYLLHYQGILENMRNNIENELEQNETENFLSASDKKEKSKKLKDLSSSLNEISKYAILIKDYADRKISIDLDDGVAVNYAKFKDLLVKIK